MVKRLYDEVYRFYETQINRKNPWCSPALVCENNFDTRFFSNQRKALIRFSTALWDEKLSTENRDTPILCMNFIRYPKTFETPECSPMYFFTTVRQKFLTKPWCPSPPMHDSFLYQFFLKHRCVPLHFFWHCDTICFRRKIEITLPRPLFIPEFFHYQNLSQKQKGSFMKISGLEKQNFFDKPVIHPNPKHDKLLYQNSFEIQMCSPANLIGTVKKILGKKVISSSDAWVFLYRKFSEIQNGYTTYSIGILRRKKNIRRKCDAPPRPCPTKHESFRQGIFSKYRCVALRTLSALWDKKLQRRKVITSSCA